MDTPKLYTLPKLAYDYPALAPIISEDLLKLHHDKHHAAYVNGANAILEKMDKARTDNADFDTKATFKELSFHIGGHLLHSLFWANLAPSGKGGGEKPSRTIGESNRRGVRLFRAVQKAIFANRGQRRGLGLGSAHVLQEDEQTHHHAGREAQHERLPHVQDFNGLGCLGARVLP